jgi:hypothetical protein
MFAILPAPLAKLALQLPGADKCVAENGNFPKALLCIKDTENQDGIVNELQCCHKDEVLKRNKMIDPTLHQVARVIYEERINEYRIFRVDRRDNVFAMAFRAIKSVLSLNGRNEDPKGTRKTTLATR